MNSALPNLVFRTTLLSFVMLIALSLCMWLIAYYTPEAQHVQTGLINAAQAKAVMPSVSSSTQSPASNHPTAHEIDALAIPSAETTLQDVTEAASPIQRIVLRFEHQNQYLSHAESEHIQNLLKHAGIEHHAQVKITAGAISSDQHLNQEQALRLRTQAIARLVFMHTQQVEIILHNAVDKTQTEVGLVTLEFNSSSTANNGS